MVTLNEISKPPARSFDRFDEFQKSINPRWKIYVDTCSLYSAMENEGAFWDRFIPALQENGCQFAITVGTFEEIKKHKRGADARKAKTASDLERVLYRFSKNQMNLMVTVGNQGEFHDQAIQAKIRSRALGYNQVYITNDLANAWDVYNTVRNSQSVNRGVKRLLIYRISKKGELVRHEQLKYLSELNQKQISEFFTFWHDGKFKEASGYLESLTDFRASTTKRKQPSFNTAKRLEESESLDQSTGEDSFAEPIVQSIINPDYDMPTTGTHLRAIRGDKVVEVELGTRIARGGEGLIYSVISDNGNDEGFLAKIYKKTKLYKSAKGASETMLKINYIVGCGFGKQPLRNASGELGQHIKFPLYVLVNDDDEFVGYLMGRATGIPLAKLIADGAVESEFRRLYPSLTKIDLIEICLSFLALVDELHGRDIIVGDMNANNILVDTQNNDVFLIDADSYQYGDRFPCNVGVEKYTSPEFLKNHDTRFRTKQNELFVVARILCEVLMMVDNPYNSTIAQDPVDDMKNGRFRYTFEFLNQEGARQSNREAPAKDLEIRWGQLTRVIKNAFGNTFHKDGKFWEPGERRTASTWKRYLEEYKNEIESSVSSQDGIVSNDVFPTQRRKWITHVSCKVCGEAGEQEPSEFNAIIYPKIDSNDLKDIARNYHFECYCQENGLVDIECVKCGSYMGVGKPERSDGKDYICQTCWEKVECANCKETFARWMLDDSGLCRKCARDARKHAGEVRVRCIECNREIPKWVHDRNGGKCDDCRFGVPTYCAHCNAYIGKRKPRTDGKEYFCEECWKPAKCARCEWDNHGKAKKWMFDARGFCRQCASEIPANPKPQTKVSRPKEETGKETARPARKKSFFERLFGW